MTEQEAKTKWCPQIQITRGWNGVVLSSRDEQWNAEVGIGCNCIASECMWWVWDDEKSWQSATDGEWVREGHCGAIK